MGNPLLPITITASGAADSIKKEFAKKLWQDYELKPLKLILMPYFLFNYYYFTEEAEGKKKIKQTSHGVLALDGHNLVIREDLVELLKSSWKRATQNVPKGDFHEKWCNIDKREQDEVLTMKTAEHFGVPKTNVVVSSARKMSVPFYYTSAVVRGKTYSIIINAVDGTDSGLKEVPAREKGYLEITKDTVNELKDPSNWLKYSKEVITESFSAGGNSTHAARSALKSKSAGAGHASNAFSFFESKGFLLLLMLIAIILIVISIFRVKF